MKLGRPAISEIPSALSEKDSYPSIVRATGRASSISRAVRALPYIPATKKEKAIVLVRHRLRK